MQKTKEKKKNHGATSTTTTTNPRAHKEEEDDGEIAPRASLFFLPLLSLYQLEELFELHKRTPGIPPAASASSSHANNLHLMMSAKYNRATSLLENVSAATASAVADSPEKDQKGWKSASRLEAHSHLTCLLIKRRGERKIPRAGSNTHKVLMVS